MKRLSACASLLLIGVASGATSAPQTDYSWDCRFTARTLCTAQGCSTGKGRTWIYLTPSQNGYWRCEGTGFDNCDHYKATVTDSGAFKVFELTGHAGFAKVGPELDVTEVVSLIDNVWINRGRCMLGPPPLIRTR
jgi:hypothetical protein